MTRKIQIVFIIFGLLTVKHSFSQSNSSKIHIVEAGQTAYSISKYYSISVEDLRASNPALDVNYTLSLGDTLFIPNTIILESPKPLPSNVHQVKAGETLYSIAKQYGFSVDLLKSMNGMISNEIKPNQLLIIRDASINVNDQPKTGPSNIPKVNTPSDTLKTKPIRKIPVPPQQRDSTIVRTASKTHLVKEKETLFSISKQYDTPTDSLIKWNRLQTTSIQTNQKLIVGWVYKNVSATTTPTPKQNTSTPSPARQSDVVVSTDQKSLKEFYQQRTNQKTEEGFGIWFQTENEMMNRTFYGLYNNVKVGSVIKVTNLMNNKYVFVKIIGRLPNTAENAGATVKLTPACKKVLANSDGKFRARVNYN